MNERDVVSNVNPDGMMLQLALQPAERRIVDLSGLVTPELTPLLTRYHYDKVITDFLFARRARPEYVIDVVNESRRLLTQSPYAACLNLLDERPYDDRSIRLRERGYLTVYRVDWACFDAHPRPQVESPMGSARPLGGRAPGR